MDSSPCLSSNHLQMKSHTCLHHGLRSSHPIITSKARNLEDYSNRSFRKQKNTESSRQIVKILLLIEEHQLIWPIIIFHQPRFPFFRSTNRVSGLEVGKSRTIHRETSTGSHCDTPKICKRSAPSNRDHTLLPKIMPSVRGGRRWPAPTTTTTSNKAVVARSPQNTLTKPHVGQKKLPLTKVVRPCWPMQVYEPNPEGFHVFSTTAS